MAQGRQLLWAAAGAVDVLWFAVGARASSTFLVAGAVVYGLLLAVFLAAEVRSRAED